MLEAAANWQPCPEQQTQDRLHNVWGCAKSIQRGLCGLTSIHRILNQVLAKDEALQSGAQSQEFYRLQSGSATCCISVVPIVAHSRAVQSQNEL